MSVSWTPARLRRTRKYKRLFAFLMVSITWSFHDRLFEIVRPKTFALETTGRHIPSIVIGAKTCLSLLKSTMSSLHFQGWSCMWFVHDQTSTDVTAAWALLSVSLGTVSAIDVSSTYFQVGTFGTLRSFIINKKSHGPNFVPWGTPEGIDPQSE